MGMIVDGDSCFDFDSRLAPKLSATLDETPDHDTFADECYEILNQELSIDDYDVVDYYDASVLSTLCNGNFKDCTIQLEKRIGKAAFSEGTSEPLGHPNDEVESSPFLLVESDGETRRVVRKSAFLWFLENGVRMHSNDRTTRVMQTSNFHLRQKLIVSKVHVMTKVWLGDWCVFKCPKKRTKENFGISWPCVVVFKTGRVKERKVKVNLFLGERTRKYRCFM